MGMTWDPDCYWRFPNLSRQGFSGRSVLGPLSRLFRVPTSYSRNFATSPAASGLLGFLVVCSMSFTFWLRHKEQLMMKEVFEKNPKRNTVIHYYYQYVQAGAAAKDIRIYAQQPAIRTIMEKWLVDPSWPRFFHYEGMVSASTAAANAVIGGSVYLFIGLRALAGMYGIGSVLQYVGAVTGLVEHVTGLINESAALVANTMYLDAAYTYLDLPDYKYKGSLTTEKRSTTTTRLSSAMFPLSTLARTLTLWGFLLSSTSPASRSCRHERQRKTTMVSPCRLYDQPKARLR